MKIDGKALAQLIIDDLKEEVVKQKIKPYLVDFLVEGKPEDYSYVRTKERYVQRINGQFTLHDYAKCPDFFAFVTKLKQVSKDPLVTGIIIQQPLPKMFSTDSLYNYLPFKKELEGRKNKSEYYPPLGLAVLTILKYIYIPGDKKDVNNIKIDMKKDSQSLKQLLKRKKIVLVGRGKTGGMPIGQVLTMCKINFINIQSNTPNPESFYREADIIITAVGKKILTKEMLKPGVILMNIGLHRENDQWKGDYDEEEVKDIAGFYTPTVGGVGPLDITYLMSNLVTATLLQK